MGNELQDVACRISELLQISSNYLVIIQKLVLHKLLDKVFLSNIIESLLKKTHKQPSHILFQKEGKNDIILEESQLPSSMCVSC